jgi:hypothetical protein
MFRSKRLWLIAAACLVIVAGAFIFTKPIKTYLHERHVMRMLNSDDPDERFEGLCGIVDCGVPVAPMFAMKVCDLFDDDELVRYTAFGFFVSMLAHEGLREEDVPEVITRVIDSLDHDDPRTRRHAASVLRVAGPRATVAMAPLRVRFESEEDVACRWAVAEAMEAISPGLMVDEALASFKDPAAMGHVAALFNRVCVRRDASADYMPEVAVAALDALVAEVAELGPDVGDWSMERSYNYDALTILLGNLLDARPDLLSLYESYRGQGIDPIIESIITESGINETP